MPAIVDFLLHMPALMKVLGTLGLILVINNLGRSLLLSVLMGTLVLGVWCGHPLVHAGPQGRMHTSIAGIALAHFFSEANLSLMAVLLLVVGFSSQMSESRVLSELVGAVRQHTSRRAAMAAMPAIVGLLPMPGGAIFSAPLVDACADGVRVDGLTKAQVNYWFRHIWEHWWPLYPGVILALAHTHLASWQFAAVQIPQTLVCLAAGWWFILRRVPEENAEHAADQAVTPHPLRAVVPLLVFGSAYVALCVLLPDACVRNGFLPLAWGAGIAVLFLQYAWRRLPSQAFVRALVSTKTFNLVALVALIRIYGAVLEAPMPDGVTLVGQMRSELEAWGIPVVAVMMTVPFVAGLACGIAVGFVGVSFPVVMRLLGPDPTTPDLLAAAAVGYAAGYVGMMLSPVHVCMLVTNQHFNAQFGAHVRGILKPCVAVLLTALLLWTVLHALPK